jgi:hypothetical protein
MTEMKKLSKSMSNIIMPIISCFQLFLAPEPPKFIQLTILQLQFRRKIGAEITVAQWPKSMVAARDWLTS